ncbi:MEMBRANE-ASSOCIATED KINASE REGULATOR 2-RELATED [Salix viminalis]|uniref:MEMBRANE-ASSOCIATED KINASE REGULATOR 2-RELATED n=1 Tax=Salix viminalis TaxID=40686 RepID=A0A9Q0YY50_SALVM|nr:MEMBRANE-ASSOCIATED KINASE REGULATOR 2-RELATED [Salix viminalis]
MEAFSLLKYWRGGGTAVGGGGGGGGCGGGDGNCNVRATKTVTAVSPNRAETDDENDNDDGPFFDLEFAVPDEEEEGGDGMKEKKGNNGADSEENDAAEASDEVEDDDMDEEREIDFTLSSASSNDRSDLNLALSPSDDLFFKGRLVPIEPSSLEPNSKSSQFSVSILKSAVKFRVFMLGLKKKPNTATTNEKAEANVVPSLASSTPKLQREKNEENGKQSKLFTVKFKVEEVPVMSLFTRDNSKSIKSSQKQNSTEESTASAAGVASSDEKQKFSKDVMQKYLQKVKPLYIRVSKRYGEKLKLSGQLSLGSGLKTPAAPPPSTVTQKTTTAEKLEKEKESVEAPAVAKGQKQGNLPSGLSVVCKHLGKRRSASSAAVEAAPPGPVLSNRRDDSLLQQHDGIQSAILHCKRSFNASRDSDSSVLSRSVSDPSHEKSIEIMSSRQIMKGKVLLMDPKKPGK